MPYGLRLGGWVQDRAGEGGLDESGGWGLALAACRGRPGRGHVSPAAPPVSAICPADSSPVVGALLFILSLFYYFFCKK